MYMHVCMYVCVYVHVSMYACLWMYVCMCVWVCMHVYAPVCPCDYKCVCLLKCWCVYMHMCVHMCMCISMHVYACVCVFVWVYVWVWICLNAGTCVCVCVCLNAEVCMWVCAYLCTGGVHMHVEAWSWLLDSSLIIFHRVHYASKNPVKTQITSRSGLANQVDLRLLSQPPKLWDYRWTGTWSQHLVWLLRLKLFQTFCWHGKHLSLQSFSRCDPPLRFCKAIYKVSKCEPLLSILCPCSFTLKPLDFRSLC